MEKLEGTILALDVGERRIGVATAHSVARIAHPAQTLDHTPDVYANLAAIVKQEHATELVVGLPRGMQGQDTAQTKYVRDFVEELKKHVTIPVYWQDEALTSQKAEKELAERGKPYAKGDVDALAATYILDDFLLERAGARV